MLDAALQSYVEEPRFGLEHRVLHGVRGAGVRRRVVMTALACSLAAAGAAVMLVGLPRPAVVRTLEVKGKVQQAHSTPPLIEQRRAVARSKAVLPKLETFPTALPLTEGERALLELMHWHPDVAKGLNAELEPLEIVPLEIVPLDKGEKQ
jgi:hypothetical protein